MTGGRPSHLEILVEGERGNLAAAILRAGGVKTELAALRCVNAVETDALPVDFDGVAVNDRGDADDGFGDGRACCKERGEHNSQPHAAFHAKGAISTDTTRTVPLFRENEIATDLPALADCIVFCSGGIARAMGTVPSA
ncbi:hypothetical protein SLT36_31475 (plasmid) [Aminobacter sp. BA135]|uniref:hypothetical protein n=1 Tax=Aminobacter sp. BA135 TaxID=537596 RepID=UPI003D78CE21